MKIMITSFAYYPEVNGVQNVTQFLAESLVAMGHRVIVLTGNKNSDSNEEEHNGVLLKRFSMEKKGLITVGEKKEYRKAVINYSVNADVAIFTCLQSPTTDWVLPVLDRVKCKTILYMHGMHNFTYGRGDFISPVELSKKILRNIYWGIFYSWTHRLIRKFNGVIHIHGEDYAYLYFKKYHLSKNYVLSNFAEKNFFRNYEKIDLRNKIFINISNYHENKNQLMLLKALYMLKDYNVQLICIGSKKNKYYHRLVAAERRLAVLHGQRKVELLYQIPRDKLPEYISQAYAFIMSSKREVFPVTIIEAMAMGVPFISTDVGINKYLPGGMIVNFDVRSLSDGMEYLLGNPEERNRMAKVASSYAHDYLSPDAYMRHFIEIVNSIMEGDIL